jgi:hypothetical protein
VRVLHHLLIGYNIAKAVRATSKSRALIAVLCVALVLSLALSSIGSHTPWVILAPLLSLFTFPVVRARVSRTSQVQYQSVALISFDGSRAPPFA